MIFSAIRQTALYRTYVRRRVRFDEFGTIFESLLCGENPAEFSPQSTRPWGVPQGLVLISSIQ